jgi:methionine aminotransferase
MKQEDRYLSLGNFYEQKRNVFIDAIKNSRFKIKNCDGTYFQLLEYSELSNKPDMEFAEYLTKEIGVAVIPLSPFYEDRKNRSIFRVCFAKSDDVLKEAAAKLNGIKE